MAGLLIQQLLTDREQMVLGIYICSSVKANLLFIT